MAILFDTIQVAKTIESVVKELLLSAGTRVLIDRPTVIQFCRNLPNFTQRQGSLPWSQQPITARIIQSTLSNPVGQPHDNQSQKIRLGFLDP